MQFFIPFLGFFIWGLYDIKSLASNPVHLPAILIFALLFTKLETILIVKAITLAKNPGYALAISRTNIVITTIVSVFLFGSFLNTLTLAAVFMTLIFSLLMLSLRGFYQCEKCFEVFRYTILDKM